MPEDRIARRNRGSPRGLWLLVALALAAGLLVIAVMLKASAADQKARRELDAVASAAGGPAPARTEGPDQRM